MSREWEDFAWASGPASPAEKMVFLCLAHHSNFSGQAFPSLERMVDMTRLSRRTVMYALSSLKRDGWVVVEKGVGRGKFSTYQLIKKVQDEHLLWGEKVQDEHLIEGEKVQNVMLKGAKSASLYRLTKRELKDLKTSTCGANEKLENKDSPKVRPQPEASPPLQMPPPDPLGNPEIRTFTDLVVCASPWAVLRNLQTSDVTPRQRVAVLTAAKLEAEALGTNLPDALRGLLAVVEGQVSALPRDELRFQGDVGKYFANRNYRVDPQHLNGGNGDGRSKLERAHSTKAERTLAALAEVRARRAEGGRFTF